MAKIIMFQFPGACSRVTMTALEEIGLDFEDRAVNLGAVAQLSPEYLALNRKGKVPALSIDGQILTENAAILYFLDRNYPKAALLPRSDDPIEANRGLSDLVWCSGTLHPAIRQIRNPARYTAGDTSGVYADGVKKFTKDCRYMSERLGSAGWWYGEHWSIIDTYLYWTYSTAGKGGFLLQHYPHLVAHAERVRARPSFQKALAREVASIKRDGLQVDAASL